MVNWKKTKCKESRRKMEKKRKQRKGRKRIQDSIE